MAKSKKKFARIILLLITIILISLLGCKLYSLAAPDISTYMAMYGTWKSRGTYGDTYTQNIKNNYLLDSDGKRVSEDTIKGYLGKTVGYPWTSDNNDYWYVKNYRQVWCLSEGQINSTDTNPLRIYGAIEIGTSSNPTYTKLYHLDGNDKKVQKGVAGISESRRAQSAFTMLVGSNAATDNITGVAQKHFYDTYSSALKTKKYLKKFYDSDVPRSNTSIKSSVSVGDETYQYTYDKYADEIVDLNTPIDKDNYKNLKCENKSFTNSGLSMKTLIEGTRSGDSNIFNMSSNSELVTSRKMILTKADGSKITYNIKKDGSKWFLYSGSTKKGRITISTGKIYLVEEVQIKKVEIEINYKYIHGILYFIGGSDTQTRGISKGNWETGTMSSSLNVSYEEEITDISMQKYILEVNGKSLGKDENGYNLRASTKTVSDESDKGLVKDNNFKKPADGSKYNVKNFYKGANPVEINVGDQVTYKISVYNNTEFDAHDVRIEDRLPFFYENLGEVTVKDEDEDGNIINKIKTKYKINTAAEVESIKMGNKDVTEDFTDKRETKSENSKSIYTGSFKRIVYTIDKLKAGDEVYFEVTLSFNTQLKDKVLTNSAFIYCDGNKKTYRTTDRDYVKMVGSYQVSLEKFVSKVNGQDITGRTETDKATAEAKAVSTYRFNESMKADGEGKIDTLNGNNILDSKKKELNNLHFTKYNNAVSVDSGDTVTFTIRLRNTGNSPVKITKIYDSFRFVEEGTYNGVKLKFNSVTGNGGGTIIDDHYGSDEDNNKNKLLDRYLITFDKAVLLNNKNDYVDVNLTYTVEIPSALTSEKLILQNKAKIVTLENKNNVAVSDEDGADNNADMDFLTNKKYSVSLEKYVSKVTSKDNQNTYDSDERKDHRHNESLEDGHKEKDPHKAELKKRVPVEIGDTVQYTIKLTNTGENPVKITQIYDTFGYFTDNSFSVTNPDGTKNVGLKFVKAEITEGYTISLDDLEYNKKYMQNRYNRYSFNISGNSIQPNESIYVYMTYEVDIPFDITDKEHSLFNKAGIIEAGIKNDKGNTVTDSDTTDNNFDMDWIKTQIYKVSLKKYVSKVTDKNSDNELTYDRSETRFNAYAQDKTNIDNYNTYKKDNPVMVEAGDKVTYTIILKNEGDTSIKINELYDYYSNKGLSYDTTIGIKGNGNGYISETTNKDPQDRNSTDVTKYKILFRDPITLAAGKSTKLEITFNVTSNRVNSVYCNVARVENILNKNEIEVKDADGPDNNTDEDWIKLKGYAVSLEKYVYQVNNKNLSEDVAQREGRAEYLTYKDGRYVDETANDSEYTVHNSQKYNKAVTVSNGSSVTYKVKVTNNGDTNVYITEIADYLPDGIIYNGTTYNDKQYCTNAADSQTDNEVKFTDLADTVIEPGTSKTLTIDVDKVIEPANSNNILKNVAQISKIKNRNGVEVEDTTPNNNRDADYIVLNYEPDPDSEYVDYNVEKIWVDGDNVAKKRPTEITVKLYRDGVYQEGKDIKLDASKGWKGQWTNLDKADKDGKTYSYTAIENPVSGYSAKHEHSASGTIITNTRETITKTVRKVWKDEAGKQITDTSKLSEITVKIYQNGTEYGTAKLNNSNSWRYTWTLPEKDDNGNLYTYDVKEDNVPEGYIASYTPDGEGIIITNTKGNPPPSGETVNKTVRKVWKDEDGKEISNTSSFGTIRVQLTRDGVPMNGEIVELNSSNNWTHTWEKLTKANGSNEYQYSVKELNIPKDYTVNVTSTGDEIIVTNNKIEDDEPETISKTVNKIWLDVNGNKIEGSESIKVQLYQDGKEYDKEITLKEKEGWTYTWNDLPKYDNNGNEHTYTVKEVKVPEEYDDIYVGDGFTIQNKQIEYTEITVKKAWVDNNDEAGKRPSSVKVQLYKGNNKVGSEITLDEGNDWTYTWGKKEKLLKADDYDVREITSTKGYEVRYVVQDSTFIIKNEYTDNPEVDPPGDPDPDPDPDPPTPDLPGASVISGYVWNDEALNKVQTAYNGDYDLEEDPIYGVNVKLYRLEDEKVVATATTNINGYYGFSDADLDLTLPEEERFIKGKRLTYIDPETGKKEVSNVWEKYYSYYVVFEYNGITYTSTTYSKYGSALDNLLTSNAREKLNNEEYDGKVVQSRTDFNARYDKINNQGAFRKYIEGDKYWNGNHNKTLTYDTMNVASYIPASVVNLNKSIERSINYWINQGFSEEEAFIRAYNDNTQTIYMQSSTEKIELSTISDMDTNLKHVNIGLRGKDIFDLELTSDVAQIDVKINNQQGVYKYANKVTLRKQDIVINDDMANVRREPSNTYVDTQEQRIRQTDMPALDEIKVTYKITVHNTSPTAGTATLITNYYDNKYTFESAYSGNITLDSEEGESGTGYKSIVITTPKTKLEQGNTMDIYVVYKLNDPSNTLKDLDKLATYNLAEIAEYTTECGVNQTEYNRGLVDKDSAPGSANTEKVRLTTTESNLPQLTNGNPTTVQYYFSGQDLSVFKYEDDTFATPTLYFVKDGSVRKLTGKVFEDKTTVDSDTRIKTGNGKLDEGEVGIYGAEVYLIEINEDGTNKNTIGPVRTDVDGDFKFEGFLPGQYKIQYYYGNTTDSALLNQGGTGVNGKSYNGEDFQSTNNTGTHGALKLNSTENYWYIYNEKDAISTATDDITRRSEVSNTVVHFTDEQMTVLNNMRDGIEEEASEVEDIMNNTWMTAETYKMLFTVEKTENLDTLPNSAELLRNNRIIAQEREDGLRLAQWAVFPGAIEEYKEYTIRNMHFGIAEVPVTTVDLQKHVSAFTITDSTGNNIIASMELKEDGSGWKLKGDVLPNLNDKIDVSIENEELQGARLEITYKVIADMNTEVNFDGQTRHIVPTITGLVDFVDNNLSYNENLGENSTYWEVTTYDYIHEKFAEQIKFDNVTPPEGTVDPSGTKYTTILKAKENNPLLLTAVGRGEAPITLEKVLTSTDSTIEEIITSTLDTSAYNNIVEIVGFDYLNTGAGAEGSDPILLPGGGIDTDGDGNLDLLVMRDRIRRPDRKIIIPGVQHDYATSEILVIHPPTGDSSISMLYLLVAIISLGILAAGVFGIKKFVIKK